MIDRRVARQVHADKEGVRGLTSFDTSGKTIIFLWQAGRQKQLRGCWVARRPAQGQRIPIRHSVALNRFFFWPLGYCSRVLLLTSPTSGEEEESNWLPLQLLMHLVPLRCNPRPTLSSAAPPAPLSSSFLCSLTPWNESPTLPIVFLYNRYA